MNFGHARTLANAGLFSEALVVLRDCSIPREDRLSAEVLRTELLERTGKYTEAGERADALLKSRNITETHRSGCYLTLGRIAAEGGRFDDAVAHLQRARTIALLERHFERAAWCQLRLLIILFDASGPEAVGPLVAELRANAARSGSPRVLAALHLHIAEIETKRGSLASAERQIALATKILEGSPNKWLQAMSQQNLANLACLRLDFQAGVDRAETAAALAAEAGWSAGWAASAVTLGNLFLYTGRLEEAAVNCTRALDGFIHGSDNFSGTLETLARIRLLQGRLDDCEDILSRIDSYSNSDHSIRRRFVYRHTLLTRARAFQQRQHYAEALHVLEDARGLAEATHDSWLLNSVRLARAELLALDTNPAEVLRVFDDLARNVTLQPPDRYAAFEQVLACGLLAVGDTNCAHAHLTRAKVIYESVGHRLGLLELTTCSTLSQLASARSNGATTEIVDDLDGVEARTNILQMVAALTSHFGRAVLVAREVIEVAVAAGCVASAIAVWRKSNGDDEVVASFNQHLVSDFQYERRLLIGAERGGQVELVLRPKPDVESFATVTAIFTLISTLQELQQARAEREERATIWPADDVPTDGDQSIIAGHMRETMALAQKVARTTVNVLISGESGTGKEIIARAIHNYSARAQKPFVPFNCAAIPRDLVESQLFGHRRGAFTGADRDYAGLIRAAAGGTLFLDEIGDLTPDLQPKLLRFLESGEISPLGEPASLTVNVRIVAATNINLEEAVRDGRFREDLFYRLNVVRLSLRPLRERRDEIPGLVNHFVARAAQEYTKGRLEIAEETMERLLLYRWPGNVRQLQNELRRMVALAEPNATLGPGLISADILGAMPIFRTAPRNEIAVRLTDKLMPTLSRIECEMIKAALRDNEGRVDAVAKALGISRKGLYLKRQRLGL